MEKGQPFNKWCWNNRTSIGQRNKHFNLNLTHYTKINSTLSKEGILGTCLENWEFLKKALTILSLNCCSNLQITDLSCHISCFQPTLLALDWPPIIVIGQSQFLNTYLVTPVCPEFSGFCVLADSLVCLKAEVKGKFSQHQEPLCSVLNGFSLQLQGLCLYLCH